MPKQCPKHGEHSDDTDNHSTSLSDRLLNALTQQELAELIDALFTVLSPELQKEAIAQLPEDTQQTVRQILVSSSIAESTEASAPQTVSLAKQSQDWFELWQAWDDIVSEASEEGGKYIIQEAHWEPPYFDATTFSEDLEGVAAQMRSLLQAAFKHEFTPDRGFVPALLEAESAISEGLEDLGKLATNVVTRSDSAAPSLAAIPTVPICQRSKGRLPKWHSVAVATALAMACQRPQHGGSVSLCVVRP